MGPADHDEHGVIARVIAWCGHNPAFTVLLVAAAAVLGWLSLQRTPLDAIPDLSDVQVIVYTEWPGRSPDLVEDQVTYPLSAALLSAPGVDVVRGTSTFGDSYVYVVFEEGTDLYWARSRVLEILATLRDALPDGVEPKLGPDATGVGWVYEYALVDDSGRLDLQQLRALQDWTLQYALEAVPGVAEVAPVGGFVKQYEVAVDPDRLRAYGVDFDQVVRAVRGASGEAGGHSIEVGGHELMIRGRGYATRTTDLAAAPLMSERGVPVRVGDVAEVQVVPEPRRGIADLDGDGEVVGGIVIMRHGTNALTVIDAVEEELARVQLPDGVRVVPTYDRSTLIEAAIDTLRHTLVEEMLVVALVIGLFLLHARSALLPILTLPVAVLLAFLPMAWLGVTANIMSLGGIAVAIGAMVDASIVLVENVHKRLSEADEAADRRAVVIGAMQEVGPSIFFSLLVMTAGFLPVFALTGTEGRLFHPLAWTKTWSMAFAALLAVTLTPALAVLLIRGRVPTEERNPLNRWLVRLYEPVVRLVLRVPALVVLLAAVAVVGTIPAWRSLSSEFMPPLNEGSLLYMPTAPPGIGPTEATAVLQAMDRQIASIPEVKRVFGKMGRADSATDPAPLGMAEVVVELLPEDQWRPGLTWGDLVGELDRTVRIPGMPNIWWMPIQTRTEMLATGVRAPVGIRVTGPDLDTIEHAAVRIAEAVERIPGTRSAFAERATGGFYLDVVVDRERAGRYGVSVDEVNDVVSMAIGGMTVEQTVEGRERYPIAVRYARAFREDPEQLGRVLVRTAHGTQVPLSYVADLRHTTGPDMVRSEDGRLVGFVFVDPGDVPLADWVADAKGVVAGLDLPPGVAIAWAGQFEYYQRASERLLVVVPFTLLLVGVLLYLNRGSAPETFIVLLAVPFSLVGAVWLLWWLGYHLSVAVWVGLIALAGLDAETGMVMLLYLDLAHADAQREGRLTDRAALREVVVEGAARRIRPKAMTVLTTMIGLLPVLWSTGTGADVMKRIAAPMVGGLTTSFLLELTVYPAIYLLWKGWSLPRVEGAIPPLLPHRGKRLG
ncbi:MAG: efflux RND transporter permease subunit [Alphaproteobacteria bacterium]|nr:efflux RND transporter permease subunit [Alphaproteobacteria bacterium]